MHGSPDVLNQREGNQLTPLKELSTNITSGFYRARWVFFTPLSFHAIPSVMSAFITSFSGSTVASFGIQDFLPPNCITAVITMHITSEIRYLFRSSYSGCISTSPSIYPAHRPASCLSSVLWCRSLSRSAAARMGLPWSYTVDHL